MEKEHTNPPKQVYMSLTRQSTVSITRVERRRRKRILHPNTRSIVLFPRHQRIRIRTRNGIRNPVHDTKHDKSGSASRKKKPGALPIEVHARRYANTCKRILRGVKQYLSRDYAETSGKRNRKHQRTIIKPRTQSTVIHGASTCSRSPSIRD